MNYNINGNTYSLNTNIRDNEQLRKTFNILAKKSFSIGFENWFQNGYWGNNYIPHTLLDGDNAVSNVSVSIMDTKWQGKAKRYIQLGTVMTDPEYRKKGLNRFLMEYVIKEWSSKCDAIFLFANDSVLDFYPRFGFKKANEYQCKKPIHKKDAAVRKLDMSLKSDIDLLLSTYKLSNPFSAFPMDNNAGLLMFSCSQFMRDDVYYIPEYEAIVISKYKGENLICYDIFSKGGCKLDDILSVMAAENTKTAVLGFTPKSIKSYEITELYEKNNTLFILKENLFINNKLMFPLLSHA